VKEDEKKRILKVMRESLKTGSTPVRALLERYVKEAEDARSEEEFGRALTRFFLTFREEHPELYT